MNMFLALDAGSSFFKLWAADEKNIRQLYCLPVPAADGGTGVWDSAVLWRLALRLLEKGISAMGQRVEGILFSTQMHGVVPFFDGAFGPFLSWQADCCQKERKPGQSWLEHFQEKISPEDMAHCGVRLKSAMGLCNLSAWLQINKILPADCEAYTLGSFFLKNMGGENITHITNATPVGCFDILRKDWDGELLGRLELEGLLLPTVTEKTKPVAYFRRIPVFADIGDQQAALFGSALAAGEWSINIGTAGQLSLLRSTFAPPAPGTEMRPYFQNMFLHTVTGLPAGRQLEMLAQALAHKQPDLQKEEIWQALARWQPEEREADTVPFDFFAGSDLAQQLRQEARELSVSRLTGVFFESMARQYALAALRLGAGANEKKRIVFTGGITARLPGLRRALEKALQVESSRTGCGEAARGLYQLFRY